MSLQVWLPLTKDLRNQGLADVTVTNNGATFDSAGKLGGCYKTLSTASIDTGFNGNWINTGSISFGGWFKFNESEIASVINSKTYSSSATSATGNLIGNNSYGGVSLQWNSNNIYASGSFSNISVQSYLRTSTNGARATSSFTLPFDTWVHIFLTYNRDTNVLSLWINGELKYTYNQAAFTDAVSRNLVINYAAIAGGNGPSAAIPFCINDVRIYDHCLSPMEVKQISQGLILHYNLSDSNIESTTNLITTEDCLSNTCYNAATSKYSYGTSTDIYKVVTTFEGRKGTKVYMGTNGNAAFPYIYVNNMYTSDGTNSPAYKTLSFDYYGTIGNYLGPYPLGSGTGTATYKILCNGIETTGEYSGYGFFPITPNKWNHIEVTFHGTTATDAQWGYIRIGSGNHTSNTSNFWFFANMQLEVKDHATGYAGIGGSRTANNTVYDNSGFCNNGISNNIVISSDTPKYKYSSVLNGSNSYIKVDSNNWMIKGMSEITINLWAKAVTWPASGRLISCTESGGFNLEAGNTGYWRFPIYVYTNSEHTTSAYKYDSNEIKIADLNSNEWNMITLVYNENGTKTYINGELHHTYNNVSYGINFNTNARLFLGCEANTASPSSPYFNGQECDVRIYATALSADDVKSLYQNCATIDPDGTIRGQIRS